MDIASAYFFIAFIVRVSNYGEKNGIRIVVDKNPYYGVSN